MSGILLLGDDRTLQHRAGRFGFPLQLGAEPSLPFDRTLIVAPRTRVPFQLLPPAFRLLETWEAAVPLWRMDATAEEAGDAADRERTRAVVRDLRVPLYAAELLFVRSDGAGADLVARWQEELAGGGDPRLAFLRAFYTVKPRLCVLPTFWLTDPRRQRGQVMRPSAIAAPLVTLELLPGQFVKVRAGTEAQVLEQFRSRQNKRNRVKEQENGNHSKQANLGHRQSRDPAGEGAADQDRDPAGAVRQDV